MTFKMRDEFKAERRIRRWLSRWEIYLQLQDEFPAVRWIWRWNMNLKMKDDFHDEIWLSR